MEHLEMSEDIFDCHNILEDNQGVLLKSSG
jgi:hypothetical protein